MEEKKKNNTFVAKMVRSRKNIRNLCPFSETAS